MVVRDADPTDVDAIAGMTDVSRHAASRLVQERTVRVHLDEEDVVAFVSFDATEDAVQLTHLAGPPDACAGLLEEIIRFAERSGLPIEMVVPHDERSTCEALEAAEFAACGEGPRFQGAGTIRYRRDVDEERS